MRSRIASAWPTRRPLLLVDPTMASTCPPHQPALPRRPRRLALPPQGTTARAARRGPAPPSSRWASRCRQRRRPRSRPRPPEGSLAQHRACDSSATPGSRSSPWPLSASWRSSRGHRPRRTPPAVAAIVASESPEATDPTDSVPPTSTAIAVVAAATADPIVTPEPTPLPTPEPTPGPDRRRRRRPRRPTRPPSRPRESRRSVADTQADADADAEADAQAHAEADTDTDAGAPVATIGVSASCGAPGVSISFTGSGSTGETSYSWDFDDGSTSDRADPSHPFSDARTYSVILTVNGPGGQDSAAKVSMFPADRAPSLHVVPAWPPRSLPRCSSGCCRPTALAVGPVAVDDHVSVPVNAPATTVDVLAGDSGDTLTIVSATDPATARSSSQLDGLSLTYQPDADFHGTDTFDYTITDGDTTDVGTVTVDVNSPPVAVDDPGPVVSEPATSTAARSLGARTGSTPAPAHGLLLLGFGVAPCCTTTRTPTAMPLTWEIVEPAGARRRRQGRRGVLRLPSRIPTTARRDHGPAGDRLRQRSRTARSTGYAYSAAGDDALLGRTDQRRPDVRSRDRRRSSSVRTAAPMSAAWATNVSPGPTQRVVADRPFRGRTRHRTESRTSSPRRRRSMRAAISRSRRTRMRSVWCT